MIYNRFLLFLRCCRATAQRSLFCVLHTEKHCTYIAPGSERIPDMCLFSAFHAHCRTVETR